VYSAFELDDLRVACFGERMFKRDNVKIIVCWGRFEVNNE